MVLNLAPRLDFASFEALWQKLVVFKQFNGRRKDHSSKGLARRTKVQEVGVALGGMADAKNSAANPYLAASKCANFLHISSGNHRYLWLSQLCFSRHKSDWKTLGFIARAIGELGRIGIRRGPAFIKHVREKSGSIGDRYCYNQDEAPQGFRSQR